MNYHLYDKGFNRMQNIKSIPTEYTSTQAIILLNKLKKHNIWVKFRTTNNIQKLVRPKIQKSIEEKTGVYEMICDDCYMFYIGLTGRSFYR